MAEYRVMWEIDIEANSPEEAAFKARMIQLKPDSTAVVFNVVDEEAFDHHVDLDGMSDLEWAILKKRQESPDA